MKLPAAEWTQRRALQALIAALDGKARFVGGAVRDTLLGIEVKDVDMATPLLPDDVMARLKVADIKVVPTGIEHGTVTAVLPDGPVEITTLRRDVSTDGRRATVAFSDDWKEDAARRDFTINALSADPDTLEVFDYFDGLADLEARRVRFIGLAEERIAEDHLRIMRYFRFLARFSINEVDNEAFGACKSAAAKLQSLSRERVADELMKLLATDDPVFAVRQMIAADVFENIVAEIDPDAGQVMAKLVSREEAHGIKPAALRRLAGLLPKNTDKAGEITKSLRLSKKMRKAIAHRVPAQAGIHLQMAPSRTASKMDPGLRRGTGNVTVPDIPALAYHRGAETARDIALLFVSDEEIIACLAALKDWQPPTFPLKGGDLIAMGMEPGPAVSETLAKVEQAWVEEGFPGEERVRELAKAVLRT